MRLMRINILILKLKFFRLQKNNPQFIFIIFINFLSYFIYKLIILNAILTFEFPISLENKKNITSY